jgi:hypothetical protein
MPNLPETLQSILDDQNLTIYGASQIIGAETDEPIKTIHRRLSEWLRKTPLSWSAIEVALNALGYEIVIVKKPRSP